MPEREKNWPAKYYSLPPLDAAERKHCPIGRAELKLSAISTITDDSSGKAGTTS